MAIVLSYKLTGIEVLTRSQVKNAIKRALRFYVGEYWFEAFLWKRFTLIGYSEYGFKPRSPKYNRAKLKHRGHNNPLVLKGEGMEEAMSEQTRARIKVTETSVTVPLPRKYNRYNPKGPNMSEEVRAVSQAELRILEGNLVMGIEDELDAEVPPHLRNQGYIGGRVKSLKLRQFRPSGNPVVRRAAA